MRWLKRLLTALLVYIGVYLPFVVIVQAITGYDFTGAYAAVAGVGAVELIRRFRQSRNSRRFCEAKLRVSSLIKREETKMKRKDRKAK